MQQFAKLYNRKVDRVRPPDSPPKLEALGMC